MPEATQPFKKTSPLTEWEATQVMWDYYKENKVLLIPDTREYRQFILEQLMLGKTAERVFRRFLQVPDSKAAKVVTGDIFPKSSKATRSPWPNF